MRGGAGRWVSFGGVWVHSIFSIGYACVITCNKPSWVEFVLIVFIFFFFLKIKFFHPTCATVGLKQYMCEIIM